MPKDTRYKGVGTCAPRKSKIRCSEVVSSEASGQHYKW